MRRARHKSEEEAFYHICTRIAGTRGRYPLQERRASRKLLRTIRFFVQVYCSRLAAFEILGNHYHFIVFLEKFRTLSRQELREKAQLLYGERFEQNTAHWTESEWEKFNRKLFDVSSLMQQINGSYAVWFNRNYNRRGHFWADRFRNPQLLDPGSVQECLLYIELNAVRAGLVRRPEQWKAGSARLRWKGKDQDLIPLSEIFVGIDPAQVYEVYRFRLYTRGACRKQGKSSISGEVLERKAAQGFGRRGMYRKRLRFYTDGLAVGAQEPVAILLDLFRKRGDYLRRRNPIPQLEGLLFSLREQRSHGD
jgi:REP element-mobilizing transposase RayT